VVREQGTLNWEQATGKRFWATLLFVTYVGFFPFTYLNLVLKTMKRFIYMGYGVNKLIFGITGTEEPNLLNF